MKKLSIIASLLLACSSAFAAVPSFSGMELKKIDGSTTFTEMDAGEAIQITLKNVSDGGKTDTKRRFYVEKNYVKGQGVFSILTKDQVLWQAPKVAGTYKIASYLENADGNSAVITQDVIVRDPYVSNPGRNNCPVNFVFVPGSHGLHGETKGWCIMKYEASPYSTTEVSGTLGNNGNTISYSSAKSPTEYATSKSFNPIYYNGSLANAKERCANVKDSNGNLLSNTSIISIDVWSSLVRDLYKQPFNWTEEAGIGSGALKVGHTDNVPSYPIISSYDDSDKYYLTQNIYNTDNFIISAQARTMKTSYGDIIWDIVGNTREYFRENYSTNNISASDFYSFVLNDGIANITTGVNGANWAQEYGKNYNYTNPLNETTYLKLLPKNILGFIPSNIPEKTVSMGQSSTTSGASNILLNNLNTYYNTYITNHNTTYNEIDTEVEYSVKSSNLPYPSTYHLSLFGYGGYFGPNKTGIIGYNSGIGNPIVYGGDYKSAINNNTAYSVGTATIQAGLFQVSSQTEYNLSTIIANDITAANIGFRCMIPAN